MMMNQASKNRYTAAINEFLESSHVVSQSLGLRAHPLSALHLSIKQHKTSSQALLLSRHGKSFNKFSSIKWQSWYAKSSAQLDKPNIPQQTETLDITEFMPLVRMIAQKIHRPLPCNIMLNDLIQDGMIGLIMAFKEHDAKLGVPFKAFAENKVKWAIMDGLRAGDWAGRSVRRRASKVAKTTEKLQGILHREPLKREIADALEVSVDDISATLGNAYGYSFVRINDSNEDETQDIPDFRMEPSAIAERSEVYSRAVSSLSGLPHNERKAFILRIICDMNGQQAATEMGVSESRVSQLYKTATEKLAKNVMHWKP